MWGDDSVTGWLRGTSTYNPLAMSIRLTQQPGRASSVRNRGAGCASVALLLNVARRLASTDRVWAVLHATDYVSALSNGRVAGYSQLERITRLATRDEPWCE